MDDPGQDKLNDDKTEFLIIGTSQQLKKVRTATLSVGDAVISPVLSARNIGAYFDSNMTLVLFIFVENLPLFLHTLFQRFLDIALKKADPN